jgi:proteasome alpha subunit
MGGHADALVQSLRDGYQPGLDLGAALRLSGQALAAADPERPLRAQGLEVALLDRARPRRAFRRLSDTEVEEILQGGS